MKPELAAIRGELGAQNLVLAAGALAAVAPIGGDGVEVCITVGLGHEPGTAIGQPSAAGEAGRLDPRTVAKGVDGAHCSRIRRDRLEVSGLPVAGSRVKERRATIITPA